MDRKPGPGAKIKSELFWLAFDKLIRRIMQPCSKSKRVSLLGHYQCDLLKCLTRNGTSEQALMDALRYFSISQLNPVAAEEELAGLVASYN
jgi:hypothetical protein